MNCSHHAAPVDDQILVNPCHFERGLFRLNVDDFEDPGEDEITEEQIHLTLVRMGRTDDPFICMKLSTTSAVKLIRELGEAVARREGDV